MTVRVVGIPHFCCPPIKFTRQTLPGISEVQWPFSSTLSHLVQTPPMDWHMSSFGRTQHILSPGHKPASKYPMKPSALHGCPGMFGEHIFLPVLESKKLEGHSVHTPSWSVQAVASTVSVYKQNKVSLTKIALQFEYSLMMSSLVSEYKRTRTQDKTLILCVAVLIINKEKEKRRDRVGKEAQKDRYTHRQMAQAREWLSRMRNIRDATHDSWSPAQILDISARSGHVGYVEFHLTGKPRMHTSAKYTQVITLLAKSTGLHATSIVRICRRRWHLGRRHGRGYCSLC